MGNMRRTRTRRLLLLARSCRFRMSALRALDPREVTTCEPWPALAGAFPFGIPGRWNDSLP
jgi:hypothetical protein